MLKREEFELQKAKDDFKTIRIINIRPNPIEGWEDICDLEAGPFDSVATYLFLRDVRISRANALISIKNNC